MDNDIFLLIQASDKSSENLETNTLKRILQFEIKIFTGSFFIFKVSNIILIDSSPNTKNTFLDCSFTCYECPTFIIKNLNTWILWKKNRQLFSNSAQSDLLIQEKEIKSKRHLKKINRACCWAERKSSTSTSLLEKSCATSKWKKRNLNKGAWKMGNKDFALLLLDDSLMAAILQDHNQEIEKSVSLLSNNYCVSG